MTYKEALELNESKRGLDFESMPLGELIKLIDDIPCWKYPFAEDCLKEIARRANIGKDACFEAIHDRDCLEYLRNDCNALAFLCKRLHLV